MNELKIIPVTIEKQVWESTLNRSMVLEAENARLRHDVGNLGYKIKNQRHEINNRLKEIKRLNELLKECKHIMSIEKDFASCHFEKDKLCKLLTKINQALGE